jgi:di/tricarboxylate transporter
MTAEQIQILFVLAATVGLFLWGRWRHDMVAVASLLACVIFGLVPKGDAFAGFGHPAVITVACVLVLSRMMQLSGAIDILTLYVLPAKAGRTTSIALLAALAAVLSAFMNNVGALALLMPLALQTARRLDLLPGQVLMPLAFGSILGGMTTLIGTPPNLIVSSFRAELGGEGFGMFDFTPVGLGVAATGLLFVALVGWRIVPRRERADAESFETGAYMAEVRIAKDSPIAGKSLREIGESLARADVQVVGQVREGLRVTAPNPGRKLMAGDILVLEAEPEGLATAVSQLGLRLVGDVGHDKEAKKGGSAEKSSGKKAKESSGKAGAVSAPSGDAGEIALTEVVARPGSDLAGRSVKDIQLRQRFGINLLALSRQGKRSVRRLRSERIREGDVLLLQGPPGAIANFSNSYACVPLAARAVRLPGKRQALAASLVMACSIGGAAFGLLPAAIAFAGGVLAAMALRLLPVRQVYEAVDWPVVVLLGALIPVAGAMSTTGTADVLARLLLEFAAGGNAVLALALILVITMTLSDFMNNAATAAVMCPIAIGTAVALNARPDSFLMAVAIGASCAFLTPIGHQNNTLILGPGGFRFGDYWPLGLPLEIVVVLTGLPLLLVFWPL